ncbi:MAG TPA: thioredoxin family protein [Mycobacteriales bacterium]|nr:thioredoxin family protein [Mycobacteriales bacterium]
MTGFVVLLATLAAATAVGFVWAGRRGRLRAVVDDEGGAADAATLRAIGVEPGPRGTLVQFSSTFCAPCRATRRVLTDVAAMVDGVAYVEVDAEANLDAVRRLRIMRTPTTFVLDAGGRVVVRASGQPRKPDVLAALGRVVPR